MTKVYKRTENGTATTISVPKAMAEVNTAMMEGKKAVRTMSSGSDRHDITYKDGRHVLLVAQGEAPPTSTEQPAADADRFSTNCMSVRGGAVHTANPYFLEKDDFVFPFCRTGSMTNQGTRYTTTPLPVTCQNCARQAEYRATATR